MFIKSLFATSVNNIIQEIIKAAVKCKLNIGKHKYGKGAIERLYNIFVNSSHHLNAVK